jgi:hypothetical protein
MKKRILTGMTLLLLGLSVSSSVFAAIACRPGLNNCPNPGDGGGIYNPHPEPARPTSVRAAAYFEVPSPLCLQADLQNAKQAALNKALVDAQYRLGSVNVQPVSAPIFAIVKCDKSIYAGSYKGFSWIIYVMVDYTL